MSMSDPTHIGFSRREALKTSMLAAGSLFATGKVAAETKPDEKPEIGIATFGFGRLSNAELARELADAGIGTIQLFLSQTDSHYWRWNGRNDISSMTAERSKAIADIYRDAGIRIHSIGVYTNLIHPDAEERKANMDYFEAMMEVANHMDVHTLITEAGHHKPAQPQPIEFHYQEEVWHRMVATGKELAELAGKHDKVVLFEPFYRGFLATAKRTRLYLEAIGSPRIRALLDPANLLEHNDIQEMFDQLGPQIDCLHAKDRKLHNDRGVAAGEGDVDYHEFVRLAAERTPHAPFIIEYVGPANYRQALAHLKGIIMK